MDGPLWLVLFLLATLGAMFDFERRAAKRRQFCETGEMVRAATQAEIARLIALAVSAGEGRQRLAAAIRFHRATTLTLDRGGWRP